MKARDLLPTETSTFYVESHRVGYRLHELAKTMDAKEFAELIDEVICEAREEGEDAEKNHDFSIHEFFNGSNDYGSDR